MEEACKVQPKLMWPAEQLPPFLFQMLFSLYSAQRELALRHYDVKLLNFFLCKPGSRLKGQVVGGTQPKGATPSTVTLHYGVSGLRYAFPLDADTPSLAMLADFGTSDISPSTLHQPIGRKQYTTLENTPPDFLLLGTRARQDSKADCFALGLCWLHLLTGRAPYEEVLESVACPKELREGLDAAWRAVPACVKRGTNAAADVYAPIRELLEDEESVLHVTLYRFLCLFGLPDEPEEKSAEDATEDGEDEGRSGGEGADDGEALDVCDSTAWQAVRAWLETPTGRVRFQKDRAQWNVFSGKAKPMVEAQRRMKQLPGSERMLRGLTRFSPSNRWSVSQALRSELFAAYRRSPSEADGRMEEGALEFLDYMHEEQQQQ